MTVELLINVEAGSCRKALSRDFTFVDHPPVGEMPQPAVAGRIRILVTTGHVGLSAAEMTALPSLSLICCVGTGYEKVDVAAACERGIVVTHGAGTNASAVADHAFALLLAAMRDIPRYDASAKRGDWRGPIGLRPIATGKRLGVVGMGGIGERVARGGAAFDMTVYYHTRTPRPDLPWRYVPSVLELAAIVDCLIVAVPGGTQTRHMIDVEVLAALGSSGFLVNVSRGSVVDTSALSAALAAGCIAGAGLDVFEDEPNIPEAIRALPNVVLTPHVAGLAPEVLEAAAVMLKKNVDLFFSGRPVLTPVPEMRSI